MPLVTSKYGHQILDSEPDTCGVCGSPMPDRASARGRPRHHCGADCRELAAAISVVTDKIGPVADCATPARWRQIRGTLWGLANTRSATRGVPSRPVQVQVSWYAPAHHGHPRVYAPVSTHASWTAAWRAVDRLTGSKARRRWCVKRRLRTDEHTHEILVPAWWR